MSSEHPSDLQHPLTNNVDNEERIHNEPAGRSPRNEYDCNVGDESGALPQVGPPAPLRSPAGDKSLEEQRAEAPCIASTFKNFVGHPTPLRSSAHDESLLERQEAPCITSTLTHETDEKTVSMSCFDINDKAADNTTDEKETDDTQISDQVARKSPRLYDDNYDDDPDNDDEEVAFGSRRINHASDKKPAAGLKSTGLDDDKNLIQGTSSDKEMPYIDESGAVAYDEDGNETDLAFKEKCDEFPASAVVRANEKITSPFPNQAGPRRYTRQRASAPGAEYVRGRAPGARPSWYVQQLRGRAEARTLSTQEEEHAPPAETASPSTSESPVAQVTLSQETAPVRISTPKIHRNLRYAFVFMIACLVVGVTVGLWVAFGAREGGKNLTTDDTSRFDPVTEDCEVVLVQAHPDVISQCHCSGHIYEVAADITVRYKTLVETLMPSVFPKFNDSLESCTAQNQALFWLASGTGVPKETTMRQRYILALLFITWNGRGWSSSNLWLSANDECSWQGVRCDPANKVVEIALNNKNLTGTLGSDFALITSLTSLSLDQNNMYGSMPSNVDSFSNLEKLSLIQNALTGTVPTEFGNWAGLKAISVSDNHLVGTLPTELGLLFELSSLQLSNNIFNGTIPSEFGHLRSLQKIALVNTSLTGTIPTEIGLWTRATTIDVSYNNFLGSTIPTEIGLLSTLTIFRFERSNINATIPIELFRVTGLQSIFGRANSLFGKIPSEIGLLSNLGYLDLGDNFLTGTIPREIGSCIEIQEVLLDGNLLSGTIPSEIGSIQGFSELMLLGNNFTGTVPDEVCDVVTPTFCAQQFSNTLQCHCCYCP